MHPARRTREPAVMALALATVLTLFTPALTTPADATTLIRASMDDLVATNSTIVVGEVLDAMSYWNQGGDFILTDVRFAVLDVLKGDAAASELTITLMGGTVEDLTTLILGSAELVPGSSYVLFLNEEDLPGAEKHLTVRDHCQGAFDLVPAKVTADATADRTELRAISQANSLPLLPDASGYFEAPGGSDGIPFNAMIASVREIATRQEMQK